MLLTPRMFCYRHRLCSQSSKRDDDAIQRRKGREKRPFVSVRACVCVYLFSSEEEEEEEELMIPKHHHPNVCVTVSIESV